MNGSKEYRRVSATSVGVLFLAAFCLGACGGDDAGSGGERWWETHTHEDPAVGYVIGYPLDWKAEKRSDEDHTVASFSPPGDTRVEVFMRAQAAEGDALPPVEQFVEIWKRGAEDFELHESESTTANAVPAIRFVYSAGKGEERKTATVYVYLMSGKLYMLLAFAPADEFETYGHTFDVMGYSFHPYV